MRNVVLIEQEMNKLGNLIWIHLQHPETVAHLEGGTMRKRFNQMLPIFEHIVRLFGCLQQQQVVGRILLQIHLFSQHVDYYISYNKLVHGLRRWKTKTC